MKPTAFPPGSLTWILGIEDTCVYPPAHFDMAPLNEHDLTDHTTHWREDLATVKDLGATAVRYGVDWPLVHTAPGTFDWTALDERLGYAAGDLGLTVIADLVHYGTPTWLIDSFADPRYPDAIAAFTGAFAARYRGSVDHITPLNEPVTTASFCGLRGIWPPARTGWAGWTTVTLAIVDGIRRGIAAARTANPDIVIVHVEASALYSASSQDLTDQAGLLRYLADLPTELLLGLVDADHPMHPWLLEHGADPVHLADFQTAIPTVDLLGVNYYPDITPRTLIRTAGIIEQITTNRWAEGLRECLQHFADRYHIPMLITETSIEGDETVRADWLTTSAHVVDDLRRDGLDIRGYTWWPLLDFVDWSYGSGGCNIEEFRPQPNDLHGSARFTNISAGKNAFLRRMGLLELQEQPDGTLRRVPTTAAPAFRTLTGSTYTPQEASDHVL